MRDRGLLFTYVSIGKKATEGIASSGVVWSNAKFCEGIAIHYLLTTFDMQRELIP